MDRIILHIDVNSAFLSWSAIKLLKEGYKKDIRNEIAVIAGDPSKRHGVIVAASVPAKKIGIRPPTNLFEARKIYKDLIVVKPDHSFYKLCSSKLIAFLKFLFPIVEQFSIDECFIDYTESKAKYGNEVEFAHKLKDEIYRRFGFTVNIGIGNNKLCAKMASDFEKPNKVHTLYLNEFKEKVWNLDINDLFMAGKASCNKLRSMGINTIGELANTDESLLISKLKSHGKLLHDYANGIDDSKLNVESYNDRKSISFSKTLEFSTNNPDKIYDCFKVFSKKIEKILKERHFFAHTVTITIRNDEFQTTTHQKKLLNSIHKEEDIYLVAKEIFNKVWDEEKIRLIGLGVSDFSESYVYQMSLFEEPVEEDNITKVIRDLNKKYGKDIIKKAKEQ